MPAEITFTRHEQTDPNEPCRLSFKFDDVKLSIEGPPDKGELIGRIVGELLSIEDGIVATEFKSAMRAQTKNGVEAGAVLLGIVESIRARS